MKNNPDKALEIFYLRYAKKLLQYAVSNWQTDIDDAWELIYQTFNRINSKIGDYSFESEQKFGSFVLVSFLNNLRNYLRDKKKNIEILSEDHISSATNLGYDEQDEIPESEKMRILKEELEKLQDWERMLLLLKAQQMPYSEIAKFIDKPENQLKVYHARLKKKITEAIILKTEVNHV